jgi:hypothetical protein
MAIRTCLRMMLACGVLLVVDGVRLAAGGDQAVDFGRDVQPVLQARCYGCHGPQRHEGGLRLDVRSLAMRGGDSGAVIVPGSAAASVLVERLRSEDAELRMPADGEALDAAQIDVIARWIDEGAVWPDALAGSDPARHWAFQPCKQPVPPKVQHQAWVRNPIDNFVLARLEAEGLAPAAEADPYTLVRRVYLDLIGLPPTPEEADAFAADPSPEAYEKVVDRLLASPAYGERWARPWLDLARYADTNGYEKDRTRSIWPYRDWVVQALNADMPFDQFSIEQLAGDLLPGASRSQQVATGFHRNTMENEEGGIDVEEFRVAALFDRVNTTATVWLGLTLGCCQCHSHKYDPFTQREYYQLMAFLNNCDEPELELFDPQVAARQEEVDAEIARLEAELLAQLPRLEAEGKFAAWQAEEAGRARRWTIVPPQSALSEYHATMTVLADGSVLVSGDKPNYDTYVLECIPTLPRITALRLEVLPDPSLPAGGPGRAPLHSVGDFLLSEVQVSVARPQDLQAEGRTPLPLAHASHSYAQEGRSAALAIDGELDTGWSIQGRTGEPHQAVFVLREPYVPQPGERLVITMHQRYIHQMVIGRFRWSFTADEPSHEACRVPAEIESILLIPAAERTPEQAQALAGAYVHLAPELAEQQKALAERRRSRPRHPTTLVLQERAPQHRRRTFVFHRGEFLKPTEEVEPDVPAMLHPFPADAPRNRLGLARWLVDPANPLVGRVVMNRQWQAFFGRGLVRTTEDFGTRGDLPTHPALLDWLAAEFIQRGWCMKAMHRLIVTSATYRQSSHATPEAYAADRENERLARGPRVRLEAEMLRDQALAASGLLSRKQGGPGVYPPQPESVTMLAWGGPGWPTSTGEDRYRRGLYTFAKRTSPFAAFILFDGPTGEACVARRERSNTAVQALTLLNDQAFVEAAQALARRAYQEAPDAAARVARIFRLCLVRPPSPDELAALLAFYHDQQARFAEPPTRAAQPEAGQAASETAQAAHEATAVRPPSVLDAAQAAGLSGTPPMLDGQPLDAEQLAELAALAAVARAVLNLDETVTKE